MTKVDIYWFAIIWICLVSFATHWIVQNENAYWVRLILDGILLIAGAVIVSKFKDKKS